VDQPTGQRLPQTPLLWLLRVTYPL
jgi:hypothetical protein